MNSAIQVATRNLRLGQESNLITHRAVNKNSCEDEERGFRWDLHSSNGEVRVHALWQRTSLSSMCWG